MSTISPQLEQVMRETGDPTSPAYQNLRAVIEESPVLMQQMNDAVRPWLARCSWDMRGLRLQETLLEQNGISLGSRAARCAYHDIQAPEIAGHFDHTADSHQHVPIYGLPAPTRLSPVLDRGASVVQLDHPTHPDHALFKQAQTGVHLLDVKVGRTPDQQSDQLASALVVAVRTNGIGRIDHAVLCTDASKVFVVQGALDSALKRIANIPTVEALNTPIAQSTQAWQQATEQIQQQARERASEQQPTIQQQGPAMNL